MVVLSLFDGCSGAQQALERTDISVTKYYASEIDQNAIAVTQYNYPNTVQLGSVTGLDDEQLLDLDVDILIGGSPCTNLSFAGKQEGLVVKDIEITTLEHYLQLKSNNFQFEGASYLFWEYIRILRLVKPKYFLLENTQMPKKWKDIFDQTVGVKPVMLNSALLSAQNRKRWYWSNIPIVAPKDQGLVVQDIIINKDYDYTCTPKKAKKSKSLCNSIALDTKLNGHDHIKRIYSPKAKSPTLNTCQGGNREAKIADASGTRYKKLSPLECERLQTCKDDYTRFGDFNGIIRELPKTQRYKMLGNGFTIDIIAHILRGITSPPKTTLEEW